MEDPRRTVKILDIDLIEEMVMNPDALPEPLRKYRHYRISYGGVNEECLYEGRILLPPTADSDVVAQLLMGLQAFGEIWSYDD